jgi:hypothetical protein
MQNINLQSIIILTIKIKNKIVGIIRQGAIHQIINNSSVNFLKWWRPLDKNKKIINEQISHYNMNEKGPCKKIKLIIQINQTIKNN